MAIDNRSFIEKTASGDLADLSDKDVVEGARLVGGFVPAGQIIDPLLAGVQGEMEGQEEYDELKATYGRNFENQSPILRDRAKQLRNRWKNRTGEAVVSAGGALAGAALGTAICPIGGTIAGFVAGGLGCFAGGAVADKAYNKFKPPPPQDAIAIAAKIDELHAQGIKVPPELTGVLALAMVNGAAGKLAEDRLEQYTGTRDFNEALQTAVSTGELKKLTPLVIEFETAAGAVIGLPPDFNDPSKTTGEQMAELINANLVTASDFIGNPNKVLQAYQVYTNSRGHRHHSARHEAPLTPLATPPRARTRTNELSNGLN